MTNIKTTTTLEVGDFITVAAWEATGQVIGIEPAMIGSDDAQRVLLQERPDADGHWYTLEPGEFTIE